MNSLRMYAADLIEGDMGRAGGTAIRRRLHPSAGQPSSYPPVTRMTSETVVSPFTSFWIADSLNVRMPSTRAVLTISGDAVFEMISFRIFRDAGMIS